MMYLFSRNRLLPWLGYFLSFGVLSCTSSRQQDDLDIAMPQKAPSEEIIAKVEAQGVIEWQHLFRPPPNLNERRQMQMKLDRWQDSGTAGDLLVKGRNQMALGRTSAASSSFREALRLDADNIDIQLELAQLYLRKSQLEPCFEFLEGIRAQLSPDDKSQQAVIFRYKYTLALAYIKSGDRDKGHDLLSELVGIDKEFTPGYAALASSYLNGNKIKMAEFIAKRGLDRGKDDASLFNILGVVGQKRSRLGLAQKFYKKAILLSPTYTPALINLATLKISRGNYKSAEKDLQTALSYQPKNAQALTSLGICQMRTNRIRAAEASFNRAIDVDPFNASARFNLGILMLQKKNKPNVAMRLFQEVLQSRDDSPEIKTLARSYLDELTSHDGG